MCTLYTRIQNITINNNNRIDTIDNNYLLTIYKYKIVSKHFNVPSR